MALSVFDDKSKPPHETDLVQALGRSGALWTGLESRLADDYAPLTKRWNFGGKPYGWSLRLMQKKRTIVYMVPCDRHFLAALVLGERAVRAALASDLPGPVRGQIESARQYAEGRGVRLEIRRRADLGAVLQLAAIKMAH